MGESLDDYVCKVADATRPKELRAAAIDFFFARGVERICYHGPGIKGPGGGPLRPRIVAEGFPDQWVADYINESLASHDPIPALALRSTAPFHWSDIENLTPLTADQRAVLARRRAANLGNGLAIPVFGPLFRNGYVGLGFASDVPALGSPLVAELQMAAQMGHAAFCRILDQIEENALSLAPREREVLEWMARGKSNSVIAEILGLSRHTVDTLNRRIFHKLGVADRTTAAIFGVGTGLVNV